MKKKVKRKERGKWRGRKSKKKEENNEKERWKGGARMENENKWFITGRRRD